MKRITLYCTDRGSHSRVHFDAFDVDGEDVELVRFRRGKSPVSGAGTAVEDGSVVPVAVPARALLPVAGHQDDRGTWRWRCVRCGRDFRLTDVNLRRLVAGLASDPAVSADLSQILR